MLIGISGKIGSGKDTVGNIIQYLTMLNINKECKITYNEWCTERGKNTKFLGRDYWEIKKFAYKLKEIIAILTGCKINDLEDQDFKNTYLSNEWSKEDYKFKRETKEDLIKEYGDILTACYGYGYQR